MEPIRVPRAPWSREDRECLHSPLQASLVAQRVKNTPAVQETRVQSLGWEDPLVNISRENWVYFREDWEFPKWELRALAS